MTKGSDGSPKAPGDGKPTGPKRGAPRARKRLMVRYGVTAPERTAFTKNVSENGLFIHTNLVMRPGTTIQVQVHFPDRTFSHWARVMWAKQVPPQLAHVVECGMGVRFVDPSPDWAEYFARWKGKAGLD